MNFEIWLQSPSGSAERVAQVRSPLNETEYAELRARLVSAAEPPPPPSVDERNHEVYVEEIYDPELYDTHRDPEALAVAQGHRFPSAAAVERHLHTKNLAASLAQALRHTPRISTRAIDPATDQPYPDHTPAEHRVPYPAGTIRRHGLALCWADSADATVR